MQSVRKLQFDAESAICQPRDCSILSYYLPPSLKIGKPKNLNIMISMISWLKHIDILYLPETKHRTLNNNILQLMIKFMKKNHIKKCTLYFEIVYIKKHRKNCECCPGHYLIVNHYPSMSKFKFRNLSVVFNYVTKSLIH